MTLTLVHWLLIGNFIMLLGVAAVMIALRRQQAREADALDQRVEQLQQAVTAISQSAIGLGRRMKQLDQRTTRIEKTPTPAGDGSDARYEQASRLAGMGATVDDLIDSLGVARAEAELLVSMRERASA